MTVAVLWHVTWKDTHEARAKKLAMVCQGVAYDVVTKPLKISGLKTLIFWGHGSPQNLCDLDAAKFVERVSDWKKKNPSLEAVEIITCNARHGNPGAPDSFTRQVKRALTAKLSDVKFRALPKATTKKGEKCNWSILLWHETSATWAYVAAPDYPGPSGPDAASSKPPPKSYSQSDYWLSKAEELLKHFNAKTSNQPLGVGFQQAFWSLEKFHGYPPDHPHVKGVEWDEKKRKEWNQDAKLARKKSYIIAGHISTLRWCLVDVT